MNKMKFKNKHAIYKNGQLMGFVKKTKYGAMAVTSSLGTIYYF